MSRNEEVEGVQIHTHVDDDDDQEKSTNSSVWTIRKGELHKGLARFGLETFCSIIVLIVCLVQITRDSDACTNSLISWYTGTIGAILGRFSGLRSSNKTK